MKGKLTISLSFPRLIALHCPKCGCGSRWDKIVYHLEEPTKSKKVKFDRALLRGSTTYSCFNCNTILKREVVVATYLKEVK